MRNAPPALYIIQHPGRIAIRAIDPYLIVIEDVESRLLDLMLSARRVSTPLISRSADQTRNLAQL